MPIALTDLPEIVEVLTVDAAPCFIVLRYPHCVRLAAAAEGLAIPDLVATLDAGAEHRFVILRHDDYRDFVTRIPVEGRIDEAHYLEKYEDVRRAVALGLLPDATAHYVVQGYLERREMRLPRKGKQESSFS